METKEFITALAQRFSKSETTTLASSLAYYSALSLAPLLILFITVSSQLSLSLQQAFYNQVEMTIGSAAAQTVQLIIDNAKERPDLATASGFIGVVTLLFSASLIFGEMKLAFNKIYECPPRPAPTGSFFHKAWFFARMKITQIGLALSCIFIMIASLAASSFVAGTVSLNQPVWRALNLIVSFAFYAGLFGLIFRAMPDVRIAWKDAFRGGLITAFLFVIGKELIALYLSHSAVASPYGAAGSFILLLIWVYYISLITFVGAHISSLIATHAHDHRPRLAQGTPIPAR